MGEILIGTSGFSFADWIGEVYPRGIKRHEMLPYYEEVLRFRALEVNFTYYSLPTAKTMESFVRRTSSDFAFVVKGFKGMTHEPGPDLKKQCHSFREGIAPLGGSLKGLLFQFPYAFRATGENMGYVRSLREEFGDYSVVVEFRNAGWLRDEYMELLRDLRAGFCIVDEPKLKGLVPFYPAVTSDTGYFRFHGRNENWFGASVDVRYDYLYTKEELREFVEPVKSIAAATAATFVFFNNCHAGKAVTNARMFEEMLAGSSRR